MSCGWVVGWPVKMEIRLNSASAEAKTCLSLEISKPIKLIIITLKDWLFCRKLLFLLDPVGEVRSSGQIGNMAKPPFS